MANNENLRTPTSEEAREIGRKGGIASGIARKQKKTMAERCAMMMNAQLSDENREKLKAQYGDIADDATMAEVVIAGQIRSAMKGNTKAFLAVADYADRSLSKDEEKEYELPARVIGEAFTQINRRIQPNKDYVFEGGRGSGKSSYVSEKIIEIMKQNPNMHLCVVRKVASTLRDSVYAQVKWAINELGLEHEFEYKVNPLEITYKKTGQKIFFRGCDDPIKLKSIKPEFGYIGVLWIEERDQLNGAEEERSVKQSVLRGGEISYFFASYNPPKSKESWVNKEILIPNENRIVHHSTYLQTDSSWLGQKFIDDAEHLKEVNPDAYDHEYLGIPNGEGGNVFEYLEIRDIEQKEIDSFDHIYQGVDWGWYPDIYAFVRVHVDEARKKIYFIDEHTGNKMKNSETAQWIIDKGYDDFIVTCDSAEPKSVNDYKDIGVNARGAVKGAGSVDYGMKFLQGYTLVIDPRRTPTVYKEYTEYEYDRDKEGNVISGYPDRGNHTIDATRYAVERLYNMRGVNA